MSGSRSYGRRAHATRRGPAAAHRAGPLRRRPRRPAARCTRRSSAARRRTDGCCASTSTAARAVPGVRAVLTAADLRRRHVAWFQPIGPDGSGDAGVPAAGRRQGALRGRGRRDGGGREPGARRGRVRARRGRHRAARPDHRRSTTRSIRSLPPLFDDARARTSFFRDRADLRRPRRRVRRAPTGSCVCDIANQRMANVPIEGRGRPRRSRAGPGRARPITSPTRTRTRSGADAEHADARAPRPLHRPVRRHRRLVRPEGVHDPRGRRACASRRAGSAGR